MLNISQRQLNLRTYYYFYTGKIDGIEGKGTKEAYKKFQKSVGLSVDGIYGSKTNKKLIEVIKDLQGKLNSKGYTLSIDGIVGNNTVNAIKDFQKNNYLVVDGIAGTKTYEKLNSTNPTSTKYKFPVNYIYVSQKYGNSHKGVDLGWSSEYYGKNQAIYACYDGVVITNSYDSKSGNYISIRHSNGDVSRYMHLKNKSEVKVGQKVQKGENIGIMGDTGNAVGNHLHFELIRNGVNVNPLDYLYAYSNQVVANSSKKLIRYI